MNLSMLANRSDPIPWTSGHKIPWDDPSFSERMLREHLNQNHDLASRSLSKVVSQVEYLHSEIVTNKGRVLDLGCGPGLYCREFSKRGYECTGIDISPASIAYAREFDRSSIYRLEDVTSAYFGDGYMLAMMLFGEFQAFEPRIASGLLSRMKRSVIPGGVVVLEVFSEEKIESMGQQSSSWRSMSSGLFSESPHLHLQEHFWFPSDRVAVGRHYIVGENGDVLEYRDTLKSYSDAEYTELFKKLGFQNILLVPSLSGEFDTKFVIGFC